MSRKFIEDELRTACETLRHAPMHYPVDVISLLQKAADEIEWLRNSHQDHCAFGCDI